VKGQAILGEDEFVGGLMEHLRKGKDISDIAKSQRNVSLPSLVKILADKKVDPMIHVRFFLTSTPC
jgi:hypothetical protein